MGIEVEIRSFISKEKYDSLLDFFRKNAELVKEDYQETYYYDSDEDLRTQKNSYGAKAWLKKGKVHDDAREEIEVRFDRNDFDNVNDIFESLGYSVEVKWFRKRFQFDWEGIKVCLDHTKGYGYIIELEKMSDEDGKEEVLSLLRDRLRELGIDETGKEEFDKKFEYYKMNWRKLVEGMKIFIACSKHFYDRIPEIKLELEENGHEVSLPNSYDDPLREERLKDLDAKEHATWKAEMLRRDEDNIAPNDAILVLNFERKGEPYYIGGATFLEIAKAWEKGKLIYLYNPIPDNIFRDELLGMQPVILNGDLAKIK